MTQQTITIGEQSAIVGRAEDGSYYARFEDGSGYRCESESDATSLAKGHLSQLAGTAALNDPSLPEDRRRERAAAFFRAAVVNTPGRFVGVM